MSEVFRHPITGLPLDATIPALEAAVNEVDERIGALYRRRAPLLVALAELRGPAKLPRPSLQTDRQRLVARCPRCGTRPGEAHQRA